jgi:hypothetical protein
MQSAIARQEQLRKLGVDTSPLYVVHAKSAAVVMILVGLTLISATAPPKSSGILAVSAQERVNENREATLLNCRIESRAVNTSVNVAPHCPLAISGLAAASSRVARSDSAKFVIADNSKAYIAYPNFFAIRNQAKAMPADVNESGLLPSKT